MTTGRQIESHANDAEAGFMLIFVVLLVAFVLIALAVAAPVVAKDLRRDKEVESAHRANEYVRAIRLYYRKFKAYPPSMDALENTNNVRFLRKQYVDPLTGKSDWRIIHVGENKTTVKGFFGQPLGGLNTAGGASLGSASSMQSSGIGGTSSSTGTTSTTIGATSGLAAGFSGATIGGSSSTTGGSSTGSGSSSSSSGFGSGGVGQIMGVGTSKTGESILNPNGQTTYEAWEFIYDPKIELLYQQSNILGGGSVGSQPASGFGSSAATGQSNSPSGSNGSSGSNGTPTPSSPPSSSPF